MLFNNHLHDFERFIGHWHDQKEYVLFGASIVCEQLLHLFQDVLSEHPLRVKYIVDFEPERYGFHRAHEINGRSPYAPGRRSNAGEHQDGTLQAGEWGDTYEVKSPQALGDEEEHAQIIITSDFYYRKIAAFLKERGLKEDIHFCSYRKIAAIWPLVYKDIVHVWRTDILLTPRCTLRCRNCNMYMPYYKAPVDQSLEQIKSDLDVYFKHIDYVGLFHLVGGEPFLFKDLQEVISYLGENYRDRIDVALITTNGTILPPKRTLALLKKHDITINISDYTKSVDYGSKLAAVIAALSENSNTFTVRTLGAWLDFGNPTVSKNLSSQELSEHFDRCTAHFRGLHNHKLYYCHLNCSAVMAGVFPDNANDFLDLEADITPEEILKFDLGFTPLGYVTFCQRCNGCNTGISVPVPVAEQGRS